MGRRFLFVMEYGWLNWRAAQASVPKGVKRIDGTGKWLMPGLTDMHVHTSNDRMGRLYMHDPNFRDGTLRIQDIFTSYIDRKSVV